MTLIAAINSNRCIYVFLKMHHAAGIAVCFFMYQSDIAALCR